MTETDLMMYTDDRMKERVKVDGQMSDSKGEDRGSDEVQGFNDDGNDVSRLKVMVPRDEG